MNEILKRATEELSKDNPNIAYVRGMLDTLLAMNEPVNEPVKASHPEVAPSKIEAPSTDEGSILDARTRALIGKIPPLTE